MLNKRNVFLIGPMGSGKTAVGRHLARLLHYTFHDSDADIEAKTGVDIPFIFEKEGEAGFRSRERESIDRLTRLESIVLATGGGAVINRGQPRRPRRARGGGVPGNLGQSTNRAYPPRAASAPASRYRSGTETQRVDGAARRVVCTRSPISRSPRTGGACSSLLKKSTGNCAGRRAPRLRIITPCKRFKST